jgi:hypothetical protein
MFVGETYTADKALDEEVELVFGQANDVTIEDDDEQTSPGRRKHLVTIRNANPFPVAFEMEFPLSGETSYRYPVGRLIGKPGKRVWAATIPANTTISTRYDAHEE